MPKQRYIVGALALLVVVSALLFWYIVSDEEVPTTAPLVTEPVPEVSQVVTQMIGQSVEGHDIVATSFLGDSVASVAAARQHLLFVGGIHGGYEWNSVLLAERFLQYFTENPDAIPSGVAVSIIPNLNPDAVTRLVGRPSGFTEMDVLVSSVAAETVRFNANDVDLNRNFDCKWAPESSWRGQTVSAGTAAFSEPEAQALRNFVLDTEPDMVAFWHSAAGNVYASECEDGVLPETLTVMNAYAEAAGYGAVPVFDAYPITGDAEGWLASIGIPAVTVELTSHDDIEWEENLRGVEALMTHYAK